MAHVYSPLDVWHMYMDLMSVQSLAQELSGCLYSCKWTRRRTQGSADDAQNWLYLPTIYPHDSLITLHRATGSQIS